MEEFLQGFEQYLQSAPLLAILAAFLAGIGASLTPCIYPLIPITVSFVGAYSGGSRLKGFFLSLFFVLGIAITYSILAIFAALTGRGFGSIASNPWVYFFIANMCLFFALAMLDVFVLQTPQFLQRAGNVRMGGYLGALLSGLGYGVVAGPCLTPILGVLLVVVGQRQQVFFGILLMFVFSLGLGVLLIIIGTFTSVVAALPKSGKWMVVIKKIFGILMLFLAEYFIFKMGQYWL
jgi:thiol:disulfide interchange protein DsbD